MAFNIDNNVALTGRVMTKDLAKAIFKNSDGSRKMRFTLAVQDNFTRKNGETSSQSIPVEAFIPASAVKVENGVETYGIYSTLRTGDLVSVAAHLEDNNYTDKGGKPVYGGVIVRIDTIKHREPKSVSDARAAQKDVAAQAAAPAQA